MFSNYNMKKSLICIFVLAVVINSYAIDGGTASFLKLGTGVRQIGMAGSGISYVNDEFSIFWNPAQLGLVNKTQIGGMFSFLKYDRVLNSLSFVKKEAGFAYSLGLVNAGIKDIPQYDEYDNHIGNFSENNLLVSMGIGSALKFVNFGGSIKLLYQSMLDNYSFGYSADLGLIFKIFNISNIGLVILNPISYVKWNTDSECESKLYPIAKLGASFFPNNILAISADWERELRDVENDKFRIGTEISIVPEFKIRLGTLYKNGQNEPEIAFGTSFTYKGITTDYAYTSDLKNNALGAAHFIGISYNLEKLPKIFENKIKSSNKNNDGK